MINKKIIVPATKPFFSKNDINYVNKNFKSIMGGKSFLSMGKYSLEFEKNYAKFIGTKYAVACNSGTSALAVSYTHLTLPTSDLV